MTTTESNKLIAEFMGKEIYQKYHESNYHISWDWLMPVVEKIEDIEEVDVNILQYGTIILWEGEDVVNNVANISFDKKIEHTYSAVVEFVKWYNEQSKQR